MEKGERENEKKPENIIAGSVRVKWSRQTGLPLKERKEKRKEKRERRKEKREKRKEKREKRKEKREKRKEKREKRKEGESRFRCSSKRRKITSFPPQYL